MVQFERAIFPSTSLFSTHNKKERFEYFSPLSFLMNLRIDIDAVNTIQNENGVTLPKSNV